MADELHAVVRLLLKRMESHPEEFTYGASDSPVGLRSSLGTPSRWGIAVQDVIEWGSEAEKAALNAALRDIRLGEIHERVMDELLNGEQRRADERRAFEEDEKRYNAMKQQTAAQQNTYNRVSGPQITGLVDTSNQSTASYTLRLGGETLTESAVQQIKKVLGVK